VVATIKLQLDDQTASGWTQFTQRIRTAEQGANALQDALGMDGAVAEAQKETAEIQRLASALDAAAEKAKTLNDRLREGAGPRGGGGREGGSKSAEEGKKSEGAFKVISEAFESAKKVFETYKTLKEMGEELEKVVKKFEGSGESEKRGEKSRGRDAHSISRKPRTSVSPHPHVPIPSGKVPVRRVGKKRKVRIGSKRTVTAGTSRIVRLPQTTPKAGGMASGTGAQGLQALASSMAALPPHAQVVAAAIAAIGASLVVVHQKGNATTAMMVKGFQRFGDEVSAAGNQLAGFYSEGLDQAMKFLGVIERTGQEEMKLAEQRRKAREAQEESGKEADLQMQAGHNARYAIADGQHGMQVSDDERSHRNDLREIGEIGSLRLLSTNRARSVWKGRSLRNPIRRTTPIFSH
jgi:hypothetical protein